MIGRRQVTSRRSTRENTTVDGCRHCGHSYWEKLPACPYCGTTNRKTSSGSFNGEKANFVDARNSMKLSSNNFYYVFLTLSIFIGVIIVFHDVVENILNDVDTFFIKLQNETRKICWVAILVQQIMFCYWLMIHYNALSSLHINKRFNGLLAWTNFIPYLNFYFPQAMVRELEDRLFYLKVPYLHIRFVPVWWFFQSIAFFYLCTPFFSFWRDYFWTTIVAECIWGVAFICQGIMLFNFGNAVNSVGGSRRRNYGRGNGAENPHVRYHRR